MQWHKKEGKKEKKKIELFYYLVKMLKETLKNLYLKNQCLLKIIN